MQYEELALAGVDVKELLDRLMNNTVLLKMVIGKFLADDTCRKLKAAVEQGDMQQAEFACHTLKGVCGNLSLKKLFADLQAQLRLFRAGEQAQAAAMTGGICREYEQAAAYLQQWLNRQ